MKKETEYRRGAEDTMQAYVAFGKKQEAAIQHASEQIGTVSATVSQIQNDVNGIIDYTIDSEKRGKLGLSAQRSITDLEKTDADYLVAALMQLAKEEGGNLTTLQQKYIIMSLVEKKRSKSGRQAACPCIAVRSFATDAESVHLSIPKMHRNRFPLKNANSMTALIL